jgi:hypothetical protein
MQWMKWLKFSDGYAAGLRRSVNMMTDRLIGLKSHDYHIIMERLLPVMFRGYFYRQLCAKEITVEMMQKLEKEIPVLLCKVEKKILPGFFSPMQHLLIHLPYEAKVVVLFSIGGCITLKEPSDILNQWLAIGQGSKGASLKHLFLRR